MFFSKWKLNNYIQEQFYSSWSLAGQYYRLLLESSVSDVVVSQITGLGSDDGQCLGPTQNVTPAVPDF